MQKFTSKNTSVNSMRGGPVLLNKISLRCLCDGTLLDYGCGKDPFIMRQTMHRHMINYAPYDPYWLYWTDNELATKLFDGGADLFFCANVLNVIDDEEEIRKIIGIALKQKHYVFSVYEGDGSGVGKQTKKDCYQRNEKLKVYFRFFPEDRKPIVYKGCLTDSKWVMA